MINPKVLTENCVESMEQSSKTKQESKVLRVGVDIGGTFTDFVLLDTATGRMEAFKLPSTPDQPARAVLQGLELIRQSYNRDAAIQMDIIHGSTVATNALLERKGARTAFVATQGFGDILQIGRQNRPFLYDLFPRPVPELVPHELRIEIRERVDQHGVVCVPLDLDALEQFVEELQAKNVEAVAICLLFSFLYPRHEQILGDRLRQAGFFVSLSSEVLPEFREFERASTTTVNAYVSPVLDRYLTELEQEVTQSPVPSRLRVMQSNGGNLSLKEARQRGVECILSGPAGGVVGARFVSQLAQFSEVNPPFEQQAVSKLITFDMGGTSTDVSLICGGPQWTREAVVGGFPIRIPILDIHTIGAGGGSIARVDAGGALRVGPESAGAQPGPACYGTGDWPTVTDANLVLGRLAGEYFLDGKMPLHSNRAAAALSGLGQTLGMDANQAALGVIEIINAHMERAIRLISVERGHDPRLFCLLSFGGAGGLHAADLARRLAIPFVIVPPMAATLSAFGMLAADIIKNYVQTVMLPGHAPIHQINQLFQPMIQRAFQDMLEARDNQQMFNPSDVILEQSVDIRYIGQSYELEVPYSDQLLDQFHEIHRQAYGYANPGNPVELVNLRLQAIMKVQAPSLQMQDIADENPAHAWMEDRPVILQRGEVKTIPFYRGERLSPGNQLNGPAIVVRRDTTILLGEGDRGQVDGYGNLWIKVKVDAKERF